MAEMLCGGGHHGVDEPWPENVDAYAGDGGPANGATELRAIAKPECPTPPGRKIIKGYGREIAHTASEPLFFAVSKGQGNGAPRAAGVRIPPGTVEAVLICFATIIKIPEVFRLHGNEERLLVAGAWFEVTGIRAASLASIVI